MSDPLTYDVTYQDPVGRRLTLTIPSTIVAPTMIVGAERIIGSHLTAETGPDIEFRRTNA